MTKKLLKATHQGELPIGETVLPCAVLEDGTRVITKSAVFKAFGRSKRGRNLGEVRVPNMPAFIDANNLQRFIGNDLIEVLKQIDYEDKNGNESAGYNASILPLMCKMYLDARQEKVLKTQQLPLARASEMLLLSLSKVGIIALIDEATGYQQVRDKDALQLFLQKFLEEEKGKWVKTFPDEFFESIFKMKGWTWSIANKGEKPQVVGHYINNYVYSRIAPKVLIELRKLNPKDESGNRKAKHPQWIDVNFGHPKLKEHLNILIAFARASGYNWSNWERLVCRALPKFDKDGSAAQEFNFPE